MSDYTDDDWFTVRGVIVSGPHSSASDTTTKVLDAVAPAIVARAKAEALREAVRDIFGDYVMCAPCANELDRRADEIERAAREARS